MSAVLSLPGPTFVDALPHGLHRNIDHGAYHVKTLGVASNSALSRLERSPAHYRAWVDGADDGESEALTFGRALHCALLEPDCFDRTHAVEPDFGDCRFKEAKASRDAWRRDHAGKTIVSLAHWAKVVGIAESVRRHPFAGKLVNDGDAELTVRWRDRETGLECKARADYHVSRHAMIVDIKTTEDARPGPFARSAAKYGYHRQCALYRAGFAAAGAPCKHFIFLACEKEPPFAVAVYSLDLEAVSRGHDAVRSALRLLADCLRTNEWPAYETGIRDLRLPEWA